MPPLREAGTDFIAGRKRYVLLRPCRPCHYTSLPKDRPFVGRGRTLDTLKAMLFVRKEWQKASIFGLGTVGKSQRYLSSKVARPWLLVVENADDRNIFFGSADTPGEVAVSVTRSDSIELHEVIAAPFIYVHGPQRVRAQAADIAGKTQIELNKYKEAFTKIRAERDTLKEVVYNRGGGSDYDCVTAGRDSTMPHPTVHRRREGYIQENGSVPNLGDPS
ncbi:hypothetical protein P885DRAFT_60238 [Corynascus similis CBS 632.67]